MAKGRPRKPITELKLSGTFSQHSSRKDWNAEVPTPVENLPPPTKYLERTRKAWAYFMTSKTKQKVLDLEDLASVNLMFDALDDYYRTDNIKVALSKGETSESMAHDDEILDKLNLIDIMKNRQWTRFDKTAAKFGVTISERQKLKIKEDAPKSELLRILEEG